MSTEKTIVMYFYCGGVTSEQRLPVAHEDDEVIGLDRGQNVPWFFNKKTGRCTNDLATLGCYRSIDPITDQDPPLLKQPGHVLTPDQELKAAKAALHKSLSQISSKN